MTINNIIGLLQTAVGVAFAVGLGYTGSNWLKTLANSAKNENIKTILTFASQAVLSAQALLGDGKVQQESASYDVKARLDENGLGDKFTEAQILAYIKQAYAINKANGTLATVKPVVSAEELKKAESVVTGTDQTGGN